MSRRRRSLGLRHIFARRTGGNRRRSEVRRSDADGPEAAHPRAAQSGRGAVFLIDAASRASLELVKSSSGEKSSTLLAAIDRTVTGGGARELQARLSSPLTDPEAIDARLDAVSYLVEQSQRCMDDVRSTLRAAPDLARALPRLAFGRGGPRDLAAVRDAIGVARACRSIAWRDGAAALACRRSCKSICERLSTVPAIACTALDDGARRRSAAAASRRRLRQRRLQRRSRCGAGLARRQPQGDGGARSPLYRRDRHQDPAKSVTTISSASSSK